MDYPNLSNPPIKEAIFNISFNETLSGNTLEAIATSKNILSKYPTKKEGVFIEHRFVEHKIDNPEKEIIKKNGYVFDCIENCGRLIKLNRENLSFHIVNRYEDWDTIIEEFFELCQEIASLDSSVKCKEVFVRYINHINVKPGAVLKDHFKLLPTDVEGLPSEINNFFLQVGFPFNGLKGLITETIKSDSEGGEKLVFIIDLRVSKSFISDLNNSEFSETFDSIRKYKNQLFFSIITEDTLKQFA